MVVRTSRVHVLESVSGRLLTFRRSWLIETCRSDCVRVARQAGSLKMTDSSMFPRALRSMILRCVMRSDIEAKSDGLHLFGQPLWSVILSMK